MSFINIHDKLERSANEDTVLCSTCICGKLLSKHMVTIDKVNKVNRLQDSLLYGQICFAKKEVNYKPRGLAERCPKRNVMV